MLACGLSQSAIAGSQSGTAALPLSVTNWSKTLAVPKFNSSLGTLSSMTFTLNSGISGTQNIESLDSAATTVTSTLAAQVTVKRPDGTVLLTHTPSVAKSNALSAYDGTTDYAGSSGITYPIATTSTGTTTLSPLSATDAALFTGSGTVSLPVTAEAVASFSGAGNLDSQSALSASATMTVVYAYVNPDASVSIAPQGALTVGTMATYAVSVRNVGTGPTTGVTTVSSSIPGGLVPVSAVGTGWSCSITGQTVSCTTSSTIPTGAAAPTIALQVAVFAGAYPSVTASATVATEKDAALANNGSTVTSPVLTPPSAAQSSTPSGNASSAPASSVATSVGSTTPTPSPSPQVDANEFAFSNTIGAFGGPTAMEGQGITDAQGCPVGDAYRNPIALNSLELCLQFVPDRDLTFSDTANDPNTRYIDTLRKTQIAGQGDFIVSGVGNHSSGKQDAAERTGVFPFEPNRPVTRFEVVKIALISNCIPVPDTLPETDVTFLDVAKDDTSPSGIFIAQTLYTAAEHGIAKGYGDGSFKPHAFATNGESLALLLRAAGVMPRGLTLASEQHWFDAYVVLAKQQHVVPQDFDPMGTTSRSEFSGFIVNIMALSSNPAVSGYAQQLHVREQQFVERELLYTPIKLAGAFQPVAGLSCEQKDPVLNGCLEYIPGAAVLLTGLSPSDPAASSVNVLSKTATVPDAESLMSAVTETQQGASAATPASRLAAVALALLGNCLPVPDYIPQTDIHFSDVSTQESDDALQDMTSRVFYSAALYGVVSGGSDGKARPQDAITRSEALMLFTRSADALPTGYTPAPHGFSDVAQEGDVAAALSFSQHNDVLPASWQGAQFQPNAPVSNAELSQFFLNIMQWSSDVRIRAYRTSVAPLLR